MHRGEERRMNLVAKSASNERRPTALIVSEVMLFREGLCAGLMRIGSLQVVATAAPDQAQEILSREPVDVVILDASRQRSLVHAAELQAVWPSLKVVAFGVCSHQDLLAGAEYGICAFVGEDGEIADINEAALMALRGESYCSPQATARLIGHIASLARSVARPFEVRLTGREREVATMAGQGLSNKQIAQQLRISPATVKNHVHNILEKSNLPSRSAIGRRLEQAPLQAVG
ncbi:MAG: response regulator transcription factor [Novosphingobium sp.]